MTICNEQYDAARSEARRARDAAEALGESGVSAGALRFLADACRETGDEGAEALYRESEHLADKLDMRPARAHAHLGLAKLYHRAGRPAEAADRLAPATAMCRDMGMTHWLEKATRLSAALAAPRGCSAPSGVSNRVGNRESRYSHPRP